MGASGWIRNLRDWRWVPDNSRSNHPSRFTRLLNINRHRRPRATLAGAFVLAAGGLSAAGVQALQGGGAPAGSAHSKTMIISSSAGSSGSASSDSGQAAGPASSSVSVSTNLDSSEDGTPTTQVTVNGQPVDVPDNGSTQQTSTNGNQQTSVTVSQSSTGDAQTRNSSHTSVNVFSQSNANVNQEDSMSGN